MRHELAEHTNMLARVDKRDEMIMDKLDQVLDKHDRFQISVDILNDKFDGVKKEEGNSQKDTPLSINKMKQIETK